MGLASSHTPFRTAVTWALVLAVIIAGSWTAAPALAATITVNTTADELNSDGDCSLREAIQAANTNAAVDACTQGTGPSDTITFAPALTAGGPATLSLTLFDTGLDLAEFGPTALDITSAITIAGPTGANGITLTRGGASNFRLFRVASGASLTLSNLTLSNGRAQGGNGGLLGGGGGGGGGAGMGGAIFNEGTLIVSASTFSGNQAVGGAGGFGGDGVSGNGGGGVGGDGREGNAATSPAVGGGPNGGLPAQPGGNGGGGGGQLGSGPGGNGGFGGGGGGGGGLTGVTFSAGNGGFGGGAGAIRASTGIDGTPGFGGGGTFGSAAGGGAGMGGAIFNRGGTVTLINSTFANNTATGGSASGGAGLGSGLGGAIFNLDGSLALSFSTLAGNAVVNGAPAGGALFSRQQSGTATVTLHASILANSTATISDAVISGGTATGSQSNIVETNAAGAEAVPAGLIIAANGDPALGALAANGGPTQTMLPGGASPAAGALGSGVAGCGTTVTTDQSGATRPISGACEIGALELPLPPPAPGGVSGARLWLRADRGVTTAGVNVTSWADQSSAGANATGVGTPVLKPTGLNGNPTIEFSGAPDRLATAPLQLFATGSSALTAFTVFDVDSNSGQQFILNQGHGPACTTAFELGVDTGQGTGVGNFGLHKGCSNATLAPANTIPSNLPVLMSTVILPTGLTPSNVNMFQNGAPLTVANNLAGWLSAGAYNTASRPLDIGARNDFGSGTYNSYHAGDIAEVIIYPRTLTATERGRVESYLALKYGTSLASDYQSSAGALLWDVGATGGFDSDIAGIGVEAASGLSQLQSTSVYSDGLLSVTGLGANITDGEFLLWGNNNGALSGVTPAPGPLTSRLARAWRVREVGEVGPLTVSFNLSAVPDLAYTGATSLTLLIDNDSDLSNATIAATAVRSGASVSFAGVDLADGQYIGLGVTTVNTAPTISDTPNQSISEEGVLGPLAVTVGDTQTAAASLTLSAASSNPTLVPAGAISLGGSGAARTLTVTPPANLSGTATITLTVSDGVLSSSDSFVLTVNPVNDPPIARPNAYSTSEDTPLAGNVIGDDTGSGVDSDPDGDPFSAVLVSGPANGALSLNPDGSFSYTPGANFNGADSFSYVAVATGFAPAASFVGADYTTHASWRTTSVAKPLDADGNQVYGSDGYLVVAGGASRSAPPPYATLAVRAGMSTFPGCTGCGEGGYLSFDNPLVAPGAGPIADVLTGVYYNGPGANNPTEWIEISFTRAGIYRLGVVTDNADFRAIAPLDLRLRQMVGGTADSGYISAAADRDRDIDYYLFDLAVNAGDVYRVSGRSDPGHGSNGIAGIFFDTVSGAATVSLTVGALNDDPTLGLIGDLGLVEDAGPQSVSLSGIGDGDPELAQTVTITATSASPALIANPTVTYAGGATGSLSFTPVANASGAATITVRATDNGSPPRFVERSFTVTVSPVNDAPTGLGLSSSTVGEALPVGTLVGSFSPVDSDGGPTYSYALVSGAGDTGNASFAISGDELRTAAVLDFEAQASYSVRVMVSDGNGGSFTGTFTIAVSNLELPPTISSAPPPNGQYAQPYSHSFSASGDPAASFSVTGGTLPPGLTLAAGGLLSGTPTQAGSFGPITVTASNGVLPAASQSFTLVIAPSTLSVAAQAKSRPYGAANPPLTYSVTGFVNGDTAAVLTGALATSATAASPVGVYPITQGTLAAANYTINFTPATLTVAGASLTVSADPQTRLYGAANPLLTYSVSGLVNGDTAAVLTGALATSADAASPVGVYPITQGTLAAANYTLSFTPASLTVGRAPLAVVADAKARSFGAANPPLTYSVSGLVAGDTAATALTGTLATVAGPASPPGAYPITQGTLDAANYTLSFTPGTLTVANAVLNVIADPQTRLYGAANPALTYSVTGFVNGDTAAILSGALATPATAASEVGVYAITQGSLAAPNYAINYTGAALEVTPAPLTVSADPQTRLYGALNPALTYSVSGLVNGDTAAALTGALATTATQLSDVGVYTITQGSLSAPNYTISYVGANLAVTPAPLNVTADNQTRLFGAPNPPLTLTYAGFVNGDDAADLDVAPLATTTAQLGSPPGAYPISVSGGADLNYTLSYVPGTFTIVATGQDPCSGDALRTLLNGSGPLIELDGACRYQLDGQSGANGHLLNLYFKADLTIDGNGAVIERAAGAGELGLLALVDSTNVTFRDLTFVGGRANGPLTELSGRGGAMMLYNSTGVSLVGVQFFDNSGSLGGALSSYGGSASVLNSVFADNQAGSAGAALYAQGPMTVLNSTITSAAPNPREALFTWDSFTLQNSIVANHAVALAAAGGAKAVSEDYNLYSEIGLTQKLYNPGTRISAGAHSFFAPGVTASFADPARRNYRLTPGAVAIDRGGPLGGAFDADGRPRPYGGSAVDLGPYEFSADGSLSIRRLAPRWAEAGAPFSVTLIVANRGPSALSNLEVREMLPAGAALAGSLGDGGSFDGKTVRWPIVALGPGESRTFTYQISAGTGVTSADYEVFAPGQNGPRAGGPAVTTAISPDIVARLQGPAGQSFDPALHGFGFAAWRDTPAGNDLSAASMYALLGPGVCAPLTGAGPEACALTATAERQRQELERTLGEGRSFGLAAASLKLFLGQPLPGGADAPAALQPGAAVTADLLRYPALQHVIAVYQAGRQWAPLADAAGAQVSDGSPGSVLSFLLDHGFDGPQDDGAYTLSITRRDGGGARSLVPYALERRAGGRYGLYVYDGAAPGDRERVIELDPGAWRYTSGGAPVAGYEGDAGSGTIALRSLSHDTSLPRSCDFCAGASGVTFKLRGQGRLLVIDSAGRRVGHAPGEGGPLNEIPGATIAARWSESEAGGGASITVPPGGRYRLRLSGEAPGGAGARVAASSGVSLDLSISGPGVAGGLSGLSLAGPGDAAELSFDDASKTISFQDGGAGQAPAVLLAVARADGTSYSFTVSGFELTTGRALSMAYDARAETFSLQDDDTARTQRYNLVLVRVNPDGTSQSYRRDDVTGGLGAGVIFALAGWDGVGRPGSLIVPNRLYVPLALRDG